MLSVRKEDFLEDLIDEIADTTQRKRGKYPNTFQNQFTNRRINAKYIELANRYAQFTDDDEIFGQMVMIIMELVKDKEYINISKTGKSDEISWIITTTEQRMWDYIQKNYTMNFVSYKGGTEEISNHFIKFDEDGAISSNCMVCLDDYTYIGGGDFISNHEIYQIGDDNPTEYEYALGLQRLDELMNFCKLTTSQKDLVLLLENTRDSGSHVYNQSEAARVKGVNRATINESWKRIQTKMKKCLECEYLKTNEEKMLDEINELFDSAEFSYDVLEWIKNNINKEYVIEAMEKLEPCDRKQIIRAIRLEPCSTKYYERQIIKFLSELHKTARRLEKALTHLCI